MDKPKEIKVADEVWIATAQLRERHPETCCFTPDEILRRVASNKFHDRVRPGIQWHISLHCVAQKAPNPATLRMLSVCEKSYHTTGRRLYSENRDNCHPLRSGKKEPFLRDIPEHCREEVRELLDRWHSQEGSTQDNQNSVSPGLPSIPDGHLGMQVNQIRLQFDIYPFLDKHRAYDIRDKIDRFEFRGTKANGDKRPYGARYKIGFAIQEIKKDEDLYRAFLAQMRETNRTERQIHKYIGIFRKYVEENEGISDRRIGMVERFVDKGIIPPSESPVDYESDQSIFTEKQIAAIHEYGRDTLSELGFNESFAKDQPKTPNPSSRLIHIENDLYSFLHLYACTEEITRIKQTKIAETTVDGLHTDYYAARFVTIQIGHGITIIKALGLYQEFMDYLSIKGKTDLNPGVLDDYTYHYDCNITALDNSPR